MLVTLHSAHHCMAGPRPRAGTAGGKAPPHRRRDAAQTRGGAPGGALTLSSEEDGEGVEDILKKPAFAEFGQSCVCDLVGYEVLSRSVSAVQRGGLGG